MGAAPPRVWRYPPVGQPASSGGVHIVVEANEDVGPGGAKLEVFRQRSSEAVFSVVCQFWVTSPGHYWQYLHDARPDERFFVEGWDGMREIGPARAAPGGLL